MIVVVLCFTSHDTQDDTVETSTDAGGGSITAISIRQIRQSKIKFLSANYGYCSLTPLSNQSSTGNDPGDMASYFFALKESRPGVWWRSSLLFSCIILGSVLYMGSEYKYLSEGKLSESMPAFPSSASLKLNEQIKALQEKVDILQKRYVRVKITCSSCHVSGFSGPCTLILSLVPSSRFWLEPLEPIWQYRGKYYLGKTADVEDKDQVSKNDKNLILVFGFIIFFSLPLLPELYLSPFT